MQYRVKALSLTGRGRKMFKAGDIVTETDFPAGTLPQLIRNGYVVAHTVNPPIIGPVPFVGERIKIAVITQVWKRPEVFEMFAEGFKRLNTHPLIDMVCIVAGSEGEATRQQVTRHGFQYIEVPNDPLATKVNQPAIAAGKLGVDYVLCLGSDDVITLELLNVYEVHMRDGYDYIGVTDFYFYDTTTKRAAYWSGYRDERRKGHTAGAGRLISSRLMKAWGWAPWEIKDSRVLDNSMQNKLLTTPHSIKTFSLKSQRVLALDIKSGTNMTPFALWDNTEYIDESIIKKQFPFVCAE